LGQKSPSGNSKASYHTGHQSASRKSPVTERKMGRRTLAIPGCCLGYSIPARLWMSSHEAYTSGEC
jgi:hypothetical protein